MVLQTQSGENHFGHSKEENCSWASGGMPPFLICRPESVPLSPHFPEGLVVLKALRAFPEPLCLCLPEPEAPAPAAASAPLAVRSAEPFSARLCVCVWVPGTAPTQQGCSDTPAIPCSALRSPSEPGPGHLPSDGTDTVTTATAAPAPSPQSRRERSNLRLCSERMTRAHIGNSTVPGSRCDLPVAHLLASVKGKSLRASVSAQYSQEHEGSCAEGRVRAGRQRGALFPPLSGVYGLKKICLFARLCRERPLPPWTLSRPHLGGWRGARHQQVPIWVQKLAMAGQGCRDVGGSCPGASVARRARSSHPRPGAAGRWFPPCPSPVVRWLQPQNPVRPLEMATETLVAMVILNSSDSDVALLRQQHPQPLGGNAGTFFSLVAEKGSECPFCSLLAALQWRSFGAVLLFP